MTTLLDRIDSRPDRRPTGDRDHARPAAPRHHGRRAASRSPGSAPRRPSPPSRRPSAAEAFDAEGQFLSAGKKLLDTAPPRLPRRHRRPRQGRRLLAGR